MSYRGDNVLSTFGMDQNPSSLVARAIRTVASQPTTWSDAEYRRLTGMYGVPDQEPLYVSSETTFDMICDDLIVNGWYLFDWGLSFKPLFVLPTEDNTLYKVQFGSAHQPEAYVSVRLFGSEVQAFANDMESSGNWFLLVYTEVK
jgi:hypothetical protein